MVDIEILIPNRAVHQILHAETLKKGAEALGMSARMSFGQVSNVKCVACWGWRTGRRLRAEGHKVLVMERGYLGDRFSYTSLGWNGLNGHAEFPVYPDDKGERFGRLGLTVKPWKERGENILLLGQVPRDASLKGMNMVPFYEEWAKVAGSAYGLPVVFRPHPDLAKKGIRQNVRGVDKSVGSLAEAFDKCLFCITYNSNSAVDAVLNGVPVVAMDAGTMAYSMASPNLKGPLVKPDRTKWLHQLAYTQWTIEEIRSGLPLKKLLEMKE